MPFETRPFDLGNTLARAAQISSLQNRNELTRMNIDQTRGINNALATGDDDALRQSPAGIEILTKIATLDAKEQDAAFKRGRTINSIARGILGSKDKRQAAAYALGRPEIAKMFSNVDLSVLSEGELIRQVEQLEMETRVFTDPSIVSGVVQGSKQFREGADFVTRSTASGVPDMSPAGVLTTSKIDRISRVEQGPPGSFGTPSQRGAQQVELETRVAAVNAFGSQSKRLLDIIRETPGANTLTA
ncbi:hypothetical protein LCGC14_1960460, partial [marine sediment metagenome]